MRKGFTLIELLAVIVILAIIALIATPIVINIINDAKESSYEKSVENYGRSLENYIGDYLLTNNVDYRNIKLSDIEDKIQYKGSKVKCTKLYFKENHSIVLTGCTVDNIGTYKYENKQAKKYKDTYQIGDLIKVNDIEFYVIKDSNKEEDYIVALKKEPLTVDEVNAYGVDADGTNYVNVNTYSSRGTSYNYENNVGGMAFYSSSTCHDNYSNSSPVTEGCVTNYEDSHIKHVVDNWTNETFKNNELKTVNDYNSRLITYEEAMFLGYAEQVKRPTGSTCQYCTRSDAPDWIHDNYPCWTMTAYDDSNVYYISQLVQDYNTLVSQLLHRQPSNYNGNTVGAVRPVINVYKDKID